MLSKARESVYTHQKIDIVLDYESKPSQKELIQGVSFEFASTEVCETPNFNSD